MKKLTFKLILLLITTSLFGQWVPVPIGASNSAVTSMFAFVDTVMAGTDGDGIFKTLNQGTSWIDISGNIGNEFINDMRGGVASTVIWAATEDGAYLTQDHVNYENCTSTGLTTTDISYFWFGDGSALAEWAIGTNGGGVFCSPNVNGPWNTMSNGLTGNGLFINDLSGYDDGEDSYAVVATNNGIYFSFDNMNTWTQGNNGLSGEQLIVKRLGCLGTAVMIATHGGFYYTADFGESWIPVIPDEKFNVLLVYPSGTGINIFIMGETGYYSPDMSNFYPIDLTGVGEVISIAATSTHLFVGTTEEDKNGKSGGLYRLPLDQINTGVSEPLISVSGTAHLDQNFPNPFNSNTDVGYTLTHSGFVCLKVCDYSGREVSTLVNEFQGTGRYSIRLDAGVFPSGIYYYVLIVNGIIVQTRKMILSR